MFARMIRRWWVWAILLVACVGGILCWGVNWSDGPHSVVFAYLTLEDQWLGPMMPEVNEVEVTLLKGTKGDTYMEGKIDDYISGGTKTVRRRDADEK